MLMKYSLGCNFDSELIDFVKSVDTKHQIESMFGKLKMDVFGGGRASNILPELSWKQLKNYVQKCSEAGIGFNYLLNPMCLGNRELSPGEHKEMLKFLNTLESIGINHVTINSPYLCELIKKKFPKMKVTIGLYAYIYSLQHVKSWKELGADELTLHHRVNRNFNELRRMMIYAKENELNLRVIANNVCLHDCPYQINHGCGQAHASQEKDEHKCIYLDYNLLKCNYGKISNPYALLASEWIRPEDIKYYSRLCDEVGYQGFSVKLLERTKTTDFLKRVVNAYLTEKYEGNLIDILTWGTTKSTKEFDKKNIYLRAITGKYNLAGLKKYEEVFSLPNIMIDNTKLNGFLENFLKNYNCEKKICAEYNDKETEYSCSYCYAWAKKVVSYEENERKEWMANAKQVINSMTGSNIFLSRGR